MAPAVGGIPDRPAAEQRCAAADLAQVVLHDPRILGGAQLTVAGVDDDVGALVHRGPDLGDRAERGSTTSGQAGGVEQGDEGHDHSRWVMARRRSASGQVASTRQPRAATPTEAQATVMARRTGSLPVPRAIPCTMATGQNANAAGGPPARPAPGAVVAVMRSRRPPRRCRPRWCRDPPTRSRIPT